jgi:putative PIN family toxin of toxin-antitoxin system
MSATPRLVFDTNILISRLLIPTGTPAQAVRKALSEGRIIVSDDTLNELASVISRPKFDSYISLQNRKEFFRLLGRVVEKVTIIRNIQVCRDPKDDKFLELAVNGQAEAIITGDQDLLALHPFQSIQIITPGKYLQGMKAFP